ncbi:MAG: ribonuclease Z [Chloroflexi bacterium]|nr:ribonuclease Z [Chloroflexota bacterium]
MPKLVILGSSNAIPDPDHDNTHMALVEEERVVLIDCVNSPLPRLERAGIDHLKVTDMILTHFHPDHVSGVPSFLMGVWLLGRKTPLNIYGFDYTLERMEKLMEFYDWASWPRFFPVNFIRIPEMELSPLLSNESYRIFASPVKHLVPTFGLRIEFALGRTLAYSCDTSPCEAVTGLAAGADVLIHEASGATLGHSSAAQAGEAAAKAGAKHLYLIHYPTGKALRPTLAAEAQAAYNGRVTVAHDFMQLDF